MKVWRITLWRILLYLEGIAILGDLATLWSLDYDALVLIDILEGLLHLVVYLLEACTMVTLVGW